jgi:hypothetical protein
MSPVVALSSRRGSYKVRYRSRVVNDRAAFPEPYARWMATRAGASLALRKCLVGFGSFSNIVGTRFPSLQDGQHVVFTYEEDSSGMVTTSAQCKSGRRRRAET